MRSDKDADISGASEPPDILFVALPDSSPDQNSRVPRWDRKCLHAARSCTGRLGLSTVVQSLLQAPGKPPRWANGARCVATTRAAHHVFDRYRVGNRKTTAWLILTQRLCRARPATRSSHIQPASSPIREHPRAQLPPAFILPQATYRHHRKAHSSTRQRLESVPSATITPYAREFVQTRMFTCHRYVLRTPRASPSIYLWSPHRVCPGCDRPPRNFDMEANLQVVSDHRAVGCRMVVWKSHQEAESAPDLRSSNVRELAAFRAVMQPVLRPQARACSTSTAYRLTDCAHQWSLRRLRVVP